jgi:hypothetical protein
VGLALGKTTPQTFLAFFSLLLFFFFFHHAEDTTSIRIKFCDTLKPYSVESLPMPHYVEKSWHHFSLPLLTLNLPVCDLADEQVSIMYHA